MTVSLINSGLTLEVSHSAEILPLDPLYTYADRDAPHPRCFIYPPRLVVRHGRRVQVGWGGVDVQCDDTESWSVGAGNIVRKGEVIGRIIRDPRYGWRLIDLAGNTMEYGMQHHDVAGAAHWRLPGADEQRAYLSELAGAADFREAAE